eukprot:COSAG06_NODE_497_length_15020_cov_7.417733_10_plen_74_part_00
MLYKKKTEYLPRQARDEHRQKHSKKRPPFCYSGQPTTSLRRTTPLAVAVVVAVAGCRTPLRSGRIRHRICWIR